MVTLPAPSAWRLRPLQDSDAAEALAFLAEQPLANVYFMSRILDEGMGSRGQTVEILRDGATMALASLSSNLVLAAAPGLDQKEREDAMAVLADRILSRMVPVRAIISDAALVDPLWRRLSSHLSPPTVIRLSQPVYAIERARPGEKDLDRVRYATDADLPALVPACAAMHLEEVGIDPLERDAAGYRMRVRELVQRRRAFVLIRDGGIAFKCELSAFTAEAVQIMGVWTRPPFRRQGLARAALEEVCGHFLRQGRAVTLFVNDFNRPAIDLYESLGFRQIGTHRALIW